MRHRIVTGLLAQIAVSSSFAAGVDFDLAGNNLSTSIVPMQHMVWEQTIPNVRYNRVEGGSSLVLQSEMLARIGVGHDAELRLGWDGPLWQRVTINGQSSTDKGTGDATVGLKKSLATNDDRLKWALLAQVNLATGDNGFTVDQPIYTLGSSLEYQYAPAIQTGITMYYDVQHGDWAWSAVPNISYKINDKWSVAADLQYRKQESQAEQWHINDSLSYNFKDNLQLTASLGYGFGAQDDQYSGGLSIGYLF